MNIKQTMIKALRHTKWAAPQSVDEEKWHEACDKAIELVEQLKEPDETKMNLKDLERANILVQDLKNLEVIAESELSNIRIKRPNGKIDYLHIDGEIEKRIQKMFEGYADELKAELKELGVEYENN
ncbi:hypothetical protein [Streptococcus lutetiensis]|uniref:hypothetical protein n=1 Tax=Streptococcus lutetiensis TaxID=150055 RepID=UPI0019655D69|nr:hypothetical protein [Streptococcus lutetiensis]